MNENDFIDNYLTDVVDKFSKTNKKVYIAGDFNFNFLNASTHNSTNEFFDKMMSNFLLPVISLPTKINIGKNTLTVGVLRGGGTTPLGDFFFISK